MLASSPWFPFWAKDYIADTNVRAMTLEERGAYVELMALCWIDGTVPASPNRLARIWGVDVSTAEGLRETLAHCFEELPDSPERWRHPRIEEEREKQERKSAHGKRAAAARHGPSKGETEDE